MSEYKAHSKDELLLRDFLTWCAKEKGAVLTDITQPVIKSGTNWTNYKFIDQMKAVEEYIRSKK